MFRISRTLFRNSAYNIVLEWNIICCTMQKDVLRGYKNDTLTWNELMTYIMVSPSGGGSSPTSWSFLSPPSSKQVPPDTLRFKYLTIYFPFSWGPQPCSIHVLLKALPLPPHQILFTKFASIEMYLMADEYSEPCQKPNMKRFAKAVNGISIWQGSEYNSR